MRRIIFFIAVLLHVSATAQVGTVKPLGSTNPKDINRVLGSLQVDSIIKLLRYASTDTCKVLGVSPDGSFVLRDKCVGSVAVIDSNTFVTITRLKDSLAAIRASISGADSNVYTTVTRLRDSITALENRILAKGYLTTEVDGSVTNELQTLSLPDSQHIAISNGNTISVPWLSSYTEIDPLYESEKNQYAKYADTGVRIATEYKRKQDSLLAATNDALKLPYSDTAQLLNNYNKALEKLGAGRNAKIYTCILRPSIDGSNNITWRFLGWSDDHDTLHAASITVNGTYLQVNFDTTCKRVLVCIATPDDDMGAAGVTVGCKGNLDNIQIYGSAPRGAWDGYFTWTGGTFTPEYAISDIIFDTSVSPTYSFKITNPTPMNPNYGNGLSYTSNYSGQNYARWSVQYMGNHGYTVSRLNDHYNPTFTVLDAAGNKVPNTAFTSTDLFMIKTGMDRRFSMSWNFNVNNFITSNSNIWLFAMMVTY
ncbi:hypothetical protein JST56_07040 [Candidatus Dependentiae bacterium]|nr:hypothetical protein [Candidatus Dependentiae bacterium]